MAGFASAFDEAMGGGKKEKKAKGDKELKRKRQADGSPAESEAPPSKRKPEPREPGDHPRDDPAKRKERKERKKAERAVEVKKRETQKKDDRKKKDKRRKKMAEWVKERDAEKAAEHAEDKETYETELALSALGRLHVLAATSVNPTWTTISDPEELEAEAENVKPTPKQLNNAERLGEIFQGVADRISDGSLSPALLNAKLPSVALSFLGCFDTFLQEALEGEERAAVKAWMHGHRSVLVQNLRSAREAAAGGTPSPAAAEGGDKKKREKVVEVAPEEGKKKKKKDKKDKKDKKSAVEVAEAPAEAAGGKKKSKKDKKKA
eukprot:Hpha_TRINITY_DN15313_c3_g11::TRINITY_DN15313_c3_g11_i1::g.90214::m.90214